MTAQDIEDSSKEMPMDLPKEISKELSQEVRSVSLEESAPIAGSRQVESGKVRVDIECAKAIKKSRKSNN